MRPFDCPKRTNDEAFEQLFGMWYQDLNKNIFAGGIQMPGEGCWFEWCITPQALCSFIIHVVTLSMLETAPNAKGDTNWKMTRIAIFAMSKLSLLQWCGEWSSRHNTPFKFILPVLQIHMIKHCLDVGGDTKEAWRVRHFYICCIKVFRYGQTAKPRTSKKPKQVSTIYRLLCTTTYN